jgi:hypothetical protein
MDNTREKKITADKVLKAVKVNFMPGEMIGWQQILKELNLSIYCDRHPDHLTLLARHNLLYEENLTYRRKSGLVDNYLKLM